MSQSGAATRVRRAPPDTARGWSVRCAPDTSAAASFSRVPVADELEHLRDGVGERRPRARRAPSTTITSSPRTPACGPRGELGERAARDLLVELRQLAADGGATVGAEGGRHVGQRRGDARAAPRRRPSCGARRRAPRKAAARSPGLRGHEALEREAVGRQPRDGERGQRRHSARGSPSPSTPAAAAAATSP